MLSIYYSTIKRNNKFLALEKERKLSLVNYYQLINSYNNSLMKKYFTNLKFNFKNYSKIYKKPLSYFSDIIMINLLDKYKKQNIENKYESVGILSLLIKEYFQKKYIK